MCSRCGRELPITRFDVRHGKRADFCRAATCRTKRKKGLPLKEIYGDAKRISVEQARELTPAQRTQLRTKYGVDVPKFKQPGRPKGATANEIRIS